MLGTILLAHGYLWWRLVRSTTRRGRGRRRSTELLVVLVLLVTAALLVPFPPVALVPLNGDAIQPDPGRILGLEARIRY